MMNDVLFNSPRQRLLAAPLRDQRRRTKSVAECGLVAGYGGVVQGPGQLGVLLMSDVRLLHLSTCGRVKAGLS